MTFESDNLFVVGYQGEHVTIGNLVPARLRHVPVMSVESAANLAAWLLVRSGVSAADFEQLVAAVKALPKDP